MRIELSSNKKSHTRSSLSSKKPVVKVRRVRSAVKMVLVAPGLKSEV